MVSLGTMALDDSPGIDFPGLRRDRKKRVLQAMETHGIDALVVGRDDNLRFVAGARRLNLAGNRPFMPAGVLTRPSGSVHVVNTWDDGIPAEIPHDHLIQLSVNPMNIVAGLQGIEELTTAATVGVDGISPLYRDLLAMAAPRARIVNADPVLRAARTPKSPDEILCIRTALAIAESSMQDVVAALAPGVSERSLMGVFRGRMAALGTTEPASEGTFCAIAPTGPEAAVRVRRLASDATIDEGDLVALSGGVLYAGYEGSVGRTWRCSTRPGHAPATEQRRLYERWREVWERVLDACRPGSTGADLLDAHEAAGEPLGEAPLAYGVGLGFEGAIAGSALGRSFDATRSIDEGSVLCIQILVAGDGAAYRASETVHVTEHGPVVLSAMSHGPLADAG
jgi:Xaa-Pro dipeptidase